MSFNRTAYMKAYTKAWRERNLAKIRVYLFETTAKRKKSHRDWCRRNPDKVAARQDRYRASHGFNNMIHFDPKPTAVDKRPECRFRYVEYEMTCATEQKS